MRKCKECKYWEYSAHECFHPDNGNLQDKDDLKFRVRWCGPEFGCVHHKKGHPGDYLLRKQGKS